MEQHARRFSRFALGSALAAASLLACPTATAESAQSQPQAWYGLQILAVDLLDAALATGAIAMGLNGGTSPLALPLGVTATIIYVAGGPAVHLGHEHAGRAVISFGLRVGAPLVLAITGWGIAMATYQRPQPQCNPSSYPCDDDSGWGAAGAVFLGVTVGGGAGILSASAVDIAVLSREPASDAPANPSRHSARPWPSLALEPSTTTVRDLGRRTVPVFGLAGTF